MKKLLPFLVILFAAQVAIGQSSLPNGNFEGWYQYPNHGFYEPDGGFFKTLNILDTIPTPPGITAYPCDTAHAGNYSAGLVTQKIELMNILIPGVIGTLTINWATFNATLGTRYTWTTKAERLQGFYQAYPVNGDSTGVVLLLSKWNTASGKRDTIAYNKLIFQGTVNTWTEFDIAIDYWDNSTMPDSITLLLLSCGGYNATNMMASVGQVGSRARFDDVTLTNIAGIEMYLNPEVDVQIAPNPVSGPFHVTLSEVVKNGTLTLYNIRGQEIRSYVLHGKINTLDASGLPAGTYFYKLTDGSKGLNSGKIVVSK
jgi:hypothetical protein